MLAYARVICVSDSPIPTNDEISSQSLGSNRRQSRGTYVVHVWKFRANFHTEWFINSPMECRSEKKKSRVSNSMFTSRVANEKQQPFCALRLVDVFGIANNDFIRFTSSQRAHATTNRVKAPKIRTREAKRSKTKNSENLFRSACYSGNYLITEYLWSHTITVQTPKVWRNPKWERLRRLRCTEPAFNCCALLTPRTID